MTLRKKLDQVKNNPNDVDAWVDLGEQLKKAGMMQEARASYERALQIDPTREALYEELLLLESHETLPAWFNELDQLAKTGINEREVRAIRKQSDQKRSHRLAIVLTSGSVACVLLLVLLSFVLLVPYEVIEVEPPVPVVNSSSDDRGQTRADAVPMGESLLLDKGIRMTIQKTFPDASQTFSIRYYYQAEGQEESEAHDAPPPNMRPYVVRVMVENVAGEEEESFFWFGNEMALQDTQLVPYDQDCGSVPEEIDGILGPKLSIGERTEGNLCFFVAQDAKIEYLVYDSYGERRYFRLTP